MYINHFLRHCFFISKLSIGIKKIYGLLVRNPSNSHTSLGMTIAPLIKNLNYKIWTVLFWGMNYIFFLPESSQVSALHAISDISSEGFQFHSLFVIIVVNNRFWSWAAGVQEFWPLKTTYQYLATQIIWLFVNIATFLLAPSQF